MYFVLFVYFVVLEAAADGSAVLIA
jgi:hypothetical protein